MTKSIVIFAGGTGGHVYPGLAIAVALRNKGVSCHWVGTEQGLEARIIPENRFPFETINVIGFRRYGFRRWAMAPFILLKSIFSAVRILRSKRPDIVLGMGGAVSAPGGVAAWLCRYPLIIHEQNTVPGLTNRILAHLSSRILEAFPNSFPKKFRAVATGNPVRPEIIKARNFKFKREMSGGCNILVFGGSGGARILNDIVPKALSRVAETDISILHQCGAHSRETLLAEYKILEFGGDIRICSFIEDMAEAYVWADLVISRSGAMTLSELATVGLVSVLVPYKYAVDDHQAKNAEYFLNQNATFMITEEEFTASRLQSLLEKIFNDKVLYNSVGNSIKALGHMHATDLVVRHCLELANA